MASESCKAAISILPRSPSTFSSGPVTVTLAPAAMNTLEALTARFSASPGLSPSLSILTAIENVLPTYFSTFFVTLGMKYDEPLESLLNVSSAHSSPFWTLPSADLGKIGEKVRNSTTKKLQPIAAPRPRCFFDIAIVIPPFSLFRFPWNLLTRAHALSHHLLL